MYEIETPHIPGEFFFAFEVQLHEYKKELWSKKISRYQIPSLSKLFQEEVFAEVYAAWEETGLHVLVDATVSEISVQYPNIQNGDSIELFVDTKNVKSAKIPHRFCHHFFFLPERIEGVLCKEITRFREDAHPLCSEEDLECRVEKKRRGYIANIFIPASCLFGYQMEKNAHIGFAYRINRQAASAQHFVLQSEHMDIASHPYLWIALKAVS